MSCFLGCCSPYKSLATSDYYKTGVFNETDPLVNKAGDEESSTPSFPPQNPPLLATAPTHQILLTPATLQSPNLQIATIPNSRKEFDLAIEAYTKALHDAEENNNYSLIAEILRDIGRVFLAKEQWTMAAKILNGALGLSHSIETPDKKVQEEILLCLAELEKQFLEKVCRIKTAVVDFEIYHERRAQFKTMRELIKSSLHLQNNDKESGVDLTKSILLIFQLLSLIF